MIFLFHVDTEDACCRIDNRTIVIPPNEPFEVPEIRSTDCNNNGPYEYLIPDHKVAEKVMEHCWYNGIVQVPVIKSKTGVSIDVDKARVEAKTKLSLAEDRILTRYVSDQQERVTQHNKPAIAPNGRVAMIIEKRGIDLKKEFNIDPPGYVLDKLNDRDAELQELRKQNEATQKQLAELLKQFKAAK